MIATAKIMTSPDHAAAWGLVQVHSILKGPETPRIRLNKVSAIRKKPELQDVTRNIYNFSGYATWYTIKHLLMNLFSINIYCFIIRYFK